MWSVTNKIFNWGINQIYKSWIVKKLLILTKLIKSTPFNEIVNDPKLGNK